MKKSSINIFLILFLLLLYKHTAAQGEIPVEHVHGSSKATVKVEITNLTELTGHKYQVNFSQQEYYLDVDGIWKEGSGPNKQDLRLITDQSNTFLTPTLSPSIPGGTFVLSLIVENIGTIDYNYVDGVLIKMPMDIVPFISSVENTAEGGLVSVLDANTGFIMTGDSSVSGYGGWQGGGEQILIKLSSVPTLPITVWYKIYDDGWAQSDPAYAQYDVGDGVVNKEGNITITEFEYSTRIENQWNLFDINESTNIIEKQNIYDGYNAYTGNYFGPVAANGHGFEIIISGDWAAPVQIFNTTDEGQQSTLTNMNAEGTYRINDYYQSGWNEQGAWSYYVYGEGTTDLNILSQDYELRWTGEWLDENDPNLLQVAPGTGSVGTLYGADNYNLADHPLNPNPGVSEPFAIQVPFEIWNVTSGEQVNVLVYHRVGDPSDNPFLTWNTGNRMYIHILNTPYSENPADIDNPSLMAKLTWNLIFWESDWVKGDILSIEYSDPITNADLFEFDTFFMEIIYPNGGEYLLAGSTVTAEWQTIGVPEIELSYSIDDGHNWDLININNQTNNTVDWTLPNVNSSECLIKISNCQNHEWYDISDDHFSIALPTDQQIPLSEGWNIFSFNVIPEEPDLLAILQPLVENNFLVTAFDGKGNSIENPTNTGWVNNIGNISNDKGYYINVNAGTELSASGLPVQLPTNIRLSTGGNFMGFPSLEPIDGLSYLNPLIQENIFIKAQDEKGNAIEYIPGIGFINNIGEFETGKGYYVRVNTSWSLELPPPTQQLNKKNKIDQQFADVEHFTPAFDNNPYNPMNIYILDIDPDLGIVEVAAFDGDLCVGASAVTGENNYISIIAGAEDITNGNIDGFMMDNVIEIRIWDGTIEQTTAYELVDTDNNLFIERGSAFLRLITVDAEETVIPTEYQLQNNYPNPFNPTTNISYSIPEISNVNIIILNSIGQIVDELENGIKNTGNHHTSWNASSFSSGVYFLKMVARSSQSDKTFMKVRKMLLIK